MNYIEDIMLVETYGWKAQRKNKIRVCNVNYSLPDKIYLE